MKKQIINDLLNEVGRLLKIVICSFACGFGFFLGIASCAKIVGGL